MTELYKAYRIIDEKPRWIIVDDTGKIVNKNPNEEELKGMVKFIEKDGRSNKKYTDRGLLNYLIKFEKENERPPTARDFINNREYSGCRIYFDRFGSWQKALKLVGLDFEAMVKKGILKNEHQKARLSEIIIRDHFKNKPMDLSGDKCDNPCDEICPNGKTYEVKSSKLFEKIFWVWSTKNKYKEEIEFYYLLAFNKDWTRLEHAWRVPGEIVDSDSIYIGIKNNYKRNIESMKRYEITNKTIEVLRDLLSNKYIGGKL